MSFGKKILEKYGYKEGDGLGKTNNGITEAIKTKLKFDQKGLGNDGKEENNHWWERVFTEAANNINVNSNDDKIAINLNDTNAVEITNKSYSLKKLKEKGTTLQYGNFLKSATLKSKGGEEEISNHVKTEDIEIKPIQVLTDEELLKACEGRTAHKGARHGLKLSGKLQRVAEQEKALLERIKQSRNEVFKAPVSITKDEKISRKRPLVELNSSIDESSSDGEEDLPINLESKVPLNKNKLKKQKRLVNVLADQMEATIVLETNVCQTPERKEKKSTHVDTPVRKSKKSKKKNDLDGIQEVVEFIEESAKARKKRKKDKKKVVDLDDDEEMHETEKKAKVDDNISRKRRKLTVTFENASDNDDDNIDKINESHHQNLRNSKTIDERAISNYENSSKKKKRDKKRKTVSLNEEDKDDDSWKLETVKKLTKYEKKKLKYQVKQKKLIEKELRAQNKSKKQKRKEEKKNFEALADQVICELNSAEL